MTNLNTAPDELIAELDAGMMVAVPLHELEASMRRAQTNSQRYYLELFCNSINPAGLEKVGEKHGS